MVTRRALLIGAETFGLGGVDNDVVAMRAALDALRFDDVRPLTGRAASRAGILGAYEALITQTRPGDAVLVYYSGHGGLLSPAAEPPRDRPPPSRMDLQFIVPTDYRDPADDDFRGVTSVELSVLLARLTEVTHNVTAVFDCCHASRMSRDQDQRVKALARPAPAAYDRVARHVARLVRGGLDLRRLDPVSNPYAVRVVACALEQSAYEQTNADGVRMGLLTDALTRTLAGLADLPVSWSTLLQRIRERVLDRAPGQRPEAEGPSRRVPFTETETDPPGTLAVLDAGGGRVDLLGAPLLGVQVGDEFALVAPGTGAGAAVRLGVAVVEHLTGASASAALRLAPRISGLPVGTRAVRTRAVVPALPVGVPADRALDGLRTAMATSTLVRPAGPEEFAAVAVRADRAGRLVLRDGIGPLHEPVVPDGPGIRRVVDNLHRLAQAGALRRLIGEAFEHHVEVAWGRVALDGSVELAASGAVLHVGERIWVRVRNAGDARVYVSLVDIGLSGRIGVLTADRPSGLRLEPGREWTLGWDERICRLVGVSLHWPDGLPAAESRLESLLAVCSEEPLDVSVLQQDGVRTVSDHAWNRLVTGTPLERLLAQVATGGSRDLGPVVTPARGYAVRAIDFLVSPKPPPDPEVDRISST